ncbi:MAG TPA: hypothetical protein PK224_10340 [Nitrospira sp.]|nr:hypothetical protein [Nitrospira sp.]
MTNDSEALLGLRVALREGQDFGLLPCETEAGRRFQVMVGELAAPVLRELVTLLCMEGLATHLHMALDEATPYIGLEITEPSTTLWIFPSATTNEITTSVQGGLYPDYASDRHVCYRALMPETLERVLVEQLRLVLCPTFPII